MTREIHPEFQLNGQTYKYKQLIEHARELTKNEEEKFRDLGSFLFSWFDQKDFIEIHTSGSTGKPKKIHLEKTKMQASASATLEFFKLTPGNTALNCLPMQYIAGRMMLVRAMVGGLHIDCVTPSSRPLSGTNKSYDFCAMVPIQVQNSLLDIHRIKKLIIGGAPCPESLKSQISNLESHIYESYGMTETISHIAVRLLSRNAQQEFFECLPDVKIRTDSKSCLVIDAPYLSTAEIITNDIVDIISSSTFRWLGRHDNIINVGGTKVIPELIEKKLSPYIPERFFVISEPNEKMGEMVVLVIERPIMKIDIKIFEGLERFEKPLKIYFISEFMETATGKIKRKESLEMANAVHILEIVKN
jgi:o-succinylbenzoate---CoA ligase